MASSSLVPRPLSWFLQKGSGHETRLPQLQKLLVCMVRKVVLISHPMECQLTSRTPDAYCSGSLRPLLRPPPWTIVGALGRTRPLLCRRRGCNLGVVKEHHVKLRPWIRSKNMLKTLEPGPLSIPCLRTFWHAIPTSFYIFNTFLKSCSCSFLILISVTVKPKPWRIFEV